MRISHLISIFLSASLPFSVWAGDKYADPKQLTDMQLCHNWSAPSSKKAVRDYRDLVAKEIAARRLFSVADWEMISRGKVAIGMPELAIACVLGPADAANRTTTAKGISVQWVYRHGQTTVRYVYSANGFVTAIQD